MEDEQGTKETEDGMGVKYHRGWSLLSMEYRLVTDGWSDKVVEYGIWK